MEHPGFNEAVIILHSTENHHDQIFISHPRPLTQEELPKQALIIIITIINLIHRCF